MLFLLFDIFDSVKLKLDGSEVLDGHDHVIEDGDVLPVHGEQPLKVDQGPDLGED